MHLPSDFQRILQMAPITPKPLHLLVAGVLATALVAGCNQKKNEYVAPPPPEVDVQKPLVQDTTVHIEFPGRTRAYERVEIRARATGFLKTREFQAGQFVKAGAPLFTIEPEEFDAAVAKAEGDLAQAKASFEIADTNYQRRKAAFEKSQAVSEIDVLSAEAEKKPPKPRSPSPPQPSPMPNATGSTQISSLR